MEIEVHIKPIEKVRRDCRGQLVRDPPVGITGKHPIQIDQVNRVCLLYTANASGFATGSKSRRPFRLCSSSS
jgi:hypothetical protein